MDAFGRHSDAPARARLRAEPLENRDTPSVTIRIDYTYNTSGFFADPTHRAALERVAAQLGGDLQDNLAAIAPSAGNTWNAAFYNSITGATVRLANPTIPANTIVVYVGGGPLNTSELGVASSGAWSGSGSPAWLNTVQGRGQAGALKTTAPTAFAPWGGFIAFDSSRNWYFGTGTPAGNQYDFASVASHELTHLLGFGLGDPAFDRWVVNGQFTGPHVEALTGGQVPVVGEPGEEPDHWAAGVTIDGLFPAMLASLPGGAIHRETPLDLAALADVGWHVGTPVGPPTTSPPPAPPAGASSTQSVAGSSASAVAAAAAGPVAFAVGGDAGPGSNVAAVGGDGKYVWTTQPFPSNYTGGVRVATADFNGDGVKDVVVGSGPGAPALVEVLNGKTQAVLFSIQPFEASFTGGVYVAAGDLNGDGKPELVVTPDQGGGPRVKVYDGNGFGLVADFWGIQDPNFRGGARPAIGANGDGTGTLIVAAGYGGGPRVAGYAGASLRPGADPVNAFPDFYAFEQSLRNGVFVAAGDVDGDGTADVIIGGGPGGGPRVTVFSGAQLAAGRLVAVADFFAGDTNSRGGVRVAAADLNGDGRADVVTGAGQQAGSRLTAYSGRSLVAGAPPQTLFDFDFYSSYGGGIFVG
jgi:hypothetical protein